MKGRRTVYGLLTVVAVGVIFTAIGLMVYNKPHRDVKTAPPAFTMTAAQLVDEFFQDEAKANAAYAGKVIQVNGRLKDIVRNDSTSILLLGDTSQFMSVSCYLQNDGSIESAGLARGKIVTVKGVCNGMLMDVILDKAILLTDEKQ